MKYAAHKKEPSSGKRFLVATLIASGFAAICAAFFPNLRLPDFSENKERRISIMDIDAKDSEVSVYDMFDYSSVFFPMRWSRIGFSKDIPSHDYSDWKSFGKNDIDYASILREESVDYLKTKRRDYSKNSFFKLILKERINEAGREKLFLSERSRLLAAADKNSTSERLVSTPNYDADKTLPIIHFGVINFKTGKTVMSGEFEDEVQYDKFSRQFLSAAEFHVNKTPNYGVSRALRMKGSGNEKLDNLLEKHIPSIMRDLDFGEYKILFFP